MADHNDERDLPNAERVTAASRPDEAASDKSLALKLEVEDLP